MGTLYILGPQRNIEVLTYFKELFFQARVDQVRIVSGLDELISGTGFIFNRNFGMDYSDSDLDMLEKLELVPINALSAQRTCRDKWWSHLYLKSLGAPVHRCLKLRDWIDSARRSEFELDLSWMLKTRRGMQGRGVTEFASTRELLNELKSNEYYINDGRYVVEEKILMKRELRALVIGERLFWYEKKGAGNMYCGAKMEQISQVSPKALELAKKLKSGLKLDFAAFDFALSAKDEVFVLDLNCYPGIKLLERHREVFVSEMRSLLLKSEKRQIK